MQFIDLKSQFDRIEGDVIDRIERVLRSQRYIMGPEVAELEDRLAEYAGVNHAIACSSGTDALVASLMAFDLQPGDAVFVPSFTFFASAESITLAGGTPVFVDSDEDTFNISIESLSEALARTKAEGGLRPRGIIAVDLFGQVADYDSLSAIAEERGLFILEDAAQAFGAQRRGKKACSFGTVGATSFYPSKPLGCYGDGGAIFTDDDEMAALIRSIRVHGQGSDKYDNVRIGLNARLDTMQAAVLLAKLDIFDDELARRSEVAGWYDACLGDVVKTPAVADECVSAWAQYTVLFEDGAQRQSVVEALGSAGVPVCVFYPIPAHLSTAYKHLGYRKGDLPCCESMAERVVSLPMHPYLKRADVEKISSVVKGALR